MPYLLVPAVRRAVPTGLALAAGGAAAWGIGVERYAYAVRQERVEVLPPGSPDIRVLHLSDLHLAPWQRRKQRFIRGLAELQPDLVIDTGDNLGHRYGLIALRPALAPFRGLPGAFVWGSNDYWEPQFKNPFLYFEGASPMPRDPRRIDIDALRDELTGLGWTDLDNSAARLVIQGVPIDLVGLDDPHREYDRLDAADQKLRGLRRRKQQAALTIGVAHAPYRRVLDAFVARGTQLILAGHTHGGQVRVPGVGALVANCDIPREQARGLSEWRTGDGRAALNVSAGVGTSIYAPVRFACRPEISLLTLTAPR